MNEQTQGDGLRAVPDRPDPDVYGHIEVYTGLGPTQTRRCTVGVHYGGPLDHAPEDIMLDPNGRVLRHPHGAGRESTEEERAAVGWTW